jgi:hypothetical protein
VGSSLEKAPMMMATMKKPKKRIPKAMFNHATILAAVTIPAPSSHPFDAEIALEALLAKTRATIARTNGQTAQDRIARTSATIASEDV